MREVNEILGITILDPTGNVNSVHLERFSCDRMFQLTGGPQDFCSQIGIIIASWKYDCVLSKSYA